MPGTFTNEAAPAAPAEDEKITVIDRTIMVDDHYSATDPKTTVDV